MIEALTQVATLLLLKRWPWTPPCTLRGVDDAKFRRQVVPGDRLRLEVTLDRRRGATWCGPRPSAEVDGQTVAEAELLLAVRR